MVASRWPQRLPFLATGIKRSVSAVVRYSRVRTEEFTVVGADRPPVRFPTIFCPRSKITSELYGAVGIHGQPWPEVSRPVWPQRAGQLRALNRLRAEALPTLPLGIDAGEIDGPVSDRGTAGALDRVARMADRNYCRPHARPFRLGLTRVL